MGAEISLAQWLFCEFHWMTLEPFLASGRAEIVRFSFIVYLELS
jgi:hypothetical protein